MTSFISLFIFFSACMPILDVSEDRNFLFNRHDGQEHFTCLYNEFHVSRFLLSGKLLSDKLLSDKLLSLRLLLVFMVTFSIASLNVDGIRDNNKRARIFEYLRSLKHDFFLLQETDVHTEDIEAWSAEWGSLLLESWWKQVQGSRDSL